MLNKITLIMKINFFVQDIIERINDIKELIIRNPDGGDLALKYCDYLIDDIFMYKKNCL